MDAPEYWIDAETNRDYLVDIAAGEAYLEQIADRTDLTARGERVALLRVLGRLVEAEDEGQGALAVARREGSERQQVAALIRLAHVVQWKRDWARADALFDEAVAAAEAIGDDSMLAFAHQHAGRNHIDQGRYAEAVRSFSTALEIRQVAGAPADQLESSRSALEVARRRLPSTGKGCRVSLPGYGEHVGIMDHTDGAPPCMRWRGPPGSAAPRTRLLEFRLR